MITSGTLLWLGTVALATMLFGLAFAVPRYHGNGDTSGVLMGTITFAMSMLFWALYSLHATNYLQLGGANTLNNSAGSLAVVGIIGGVLALVLLFDAAIRFMAG